MESFNLEVVTLQSGALSALRCVFMARPAESHCNYDVEMERLEANKSLQSIINTIVMCGQPTPLFMFIL